MELMGMHSKQPPGLREGSVAAPTGTQAGPTGTRAALTGSQAAASGTEAADRAPTGTQAVRPGARLVTEVVHAADSVTFTELAAATGLAKSTTSRLLLALERGGLVRRGADGRFRPGEMFVRYAWRGGAEAGLIEVAHPFLERLGAVTGETVNLGVAHRGLVEQIAQVDSTYLIGGTNWVGPSGTTALRRAGQGTAGLRRSRSCRQAAWKPHRADDHQPGRSGRRPGEVRRHGYAVTDEELEPGLVAVAAPVYQDGAVVVAAMSVSGPASRLTPDRIAEVAAQCVAEAAGLSADPGAPAPPAGLGLAA